MICIIALVVFAVLAIFSATYRPLAAEAFDCVFRRVTLRPCATGLDKRIKKKILGGVMKRTPKLGIFLYKHIEVFSWIFIIITLWSLVMLGISGYNYYIYGNCNGEQSTDFCIFDPTGANSQVSEAPTSCQAAGVETRNDEMTIQHLDLSQFPSKGSGTEMIVFGCYACQYTREAMPIFKELLAEHDVKYIFVHFSTKAGTEYLHAYEHCVYEQNPNEYWRFNDALFSMPVEDIYEEQNIRDVLDTYGIDVTELDACLLSNDTANKMASMEYQLLQTHIKGTPTVYIDGEFIVGPKPKRVYERLLR